MRDYRILKSISVSAEVVPSLLILELHMLAIEILYKCYGHAGKLQGSIVVFRNPTSACLLWRHYGSLRSISVNSKVVP